MATMKDIQFNEAASTPVYRSGRPEKGLTGLLIRSGLAKNVLMANVIMVLTILMLCLISFAALSSRQSASLVAPEIDGYQSAEPTI
jgi:hypothetical protein